MSLTAFPRVKARRLLHEILLGCVCLLSIGVALLPQPVAAGIYDADTPTTYKEYWVDHKEFTGGQVLTSLPTCVDTKPQGRSWYLEPSDGCEKIVEFTIPDDFSQALRAEIYLDLWRNRQNRPSASFKINEGSTFAPPVGENWSRTPYVTSVPFNQLQKGRNQIRIWDVNGAFHIHDIAIRIYFDESHPLYAANGQQITAPAGQLVSAWAKDTLLATTGGGTLSVDNDLIVLTAQVTTPARFVEFHAYYEGYDEDNDGVSRDWHNLARNNWHPGGTEEQATGGTINHIGTLLTPTAGLYTIAWRIPHIVSQSGVKFKIRLVDANGVVQDAAGGVSAPFTLSRTGATAAFVNSSFSDAVLHHDGEKPDELTKPLTINLTAAAYDAAYLIGAFWRNPQLSVNGNAHFDAFTNSEDDWALSIRALDPIWLRNNSNTIGYYYTNGFGQFIEKPGPMIVLKVATAERDRTVPQFTAIEPVADAIAVEPDRAITVQLTDSGVGIDRNQIVLRVDGQIVTPTVSGSPSAFTLIYTPTVPFAFYAEIPVVVDSCDYSGNCLTAQTYHFTIRPPLYTLDLDQVGEGNITVTPAQTNYVDGTTATITATAAAGWTLQGWRGTISGTVAGPTATLTNPLAVTLQQNHAITATFTQDHYPLTVNMVGNGSGTITAIPEQATYLYGDVVTLTVTPDPGTHFVGWSGDRIATTVTVTLTMTTHQALTATLTLEEYSLVVQRSGAGTGEVLVAPLQATYHYSDVVTLSANAAAGSSFGGWTADLTTDPITADPTLLLTMTGPLTVTANFLRDYYTLTVRIVDEAGQQSSGGAVTVTAPADPQGYQYAEMATLTAAPEPGWFFIRWQGAVNAIVPTTTLSMTADAIVTATFGQKHYMITTTTVDDNGAPTTNGQVALSAPADSAGYLYGETVTATATASSGWKFIQWDGALNTTSAVATFVVTGDATLTANFTDKTHSLSATVSDVAGGQIAIAPVGPLAFGQRITLTVVPTAGWQFVGWSGDLSGTANPATLTLDDHKIVLATLQPITYTVQVAILMGTEGVTGGTVELISDQEPPYHYGDRITLKATPAEGYRFLQWTVEPADTQAAMINVPQGEVNLTDPEIEIAVTESVTYLAEFVEIGTAKVFLPIIYTQ